MNTFALFMLSVALSIPLLSADNCSFVTFSEDDITMKSQTTYELTVTARNVQCYSSVLKFLVQHPDVVDVAPKYIIVDENTTYHLKLKALTAGKSAIRASHYCLDISSDTFLKVSVFHNNAVEVVSHVTGWLYLIMWSTANCPQIWTNYKRRSVAGLSIDFIVLHTIGHIFYVVFNVALYYLPLIKEQYAKRFPQSAKPVVFNDVVYSILVAILAFIIFIQMFVYEKGEQRASKILKTCLLFCSCVMVTTVILIHQNMLEWLDFVYVCSYLKLAISIKYVPQVITNCKRKSTEGFSIMQVFLDLSGGILSTTQMVLIAYNYNDWPLFFENCTKFGLGVVSMCFDGIFIVQHYVLYNTDRFQQKTGKDAVLYSNAAV